MADDLTFVHLHVHSDYSLSKGASKVKAIVAEAKRLGMPAVALTDENAMYGALEFSKAATDEGLQPIVGAKLYFDLGDRDRGSVILLAQSKRGYINLCTILSKAHYPSERSGGVLRPKGAPELETQFLDADSVEGLLLLTGGHDGILYSLLRKNRIEEARQTIQWLVGIFCDRAYVEVCRNGRLSPEEAEVEDRLLDLAFSFGETECADGVARSQAPIVATSEVCYSTEDRHESFEILKAVDTKGHVALMGHEVVSGTTRRYHLRDAAEMQELFADLPEAYANASQIARRAAFKVEGREPMLPPFKTEGGRSESEELRAQSEDGLERRFRQLDIPEDKRELYRSRLDYELGIIERMGFPGYFLIVSDFIKWAKAQDIPVGPGRGSGAGSVVAWALTIIDIDPMRFGLLFERLLNPERVSMPDFDIDFCQDRRAEVIHYVQNRYGMDRVSQIVTFMEIKSRTAIHDAGRVITSDSFGGFGYGDRDQLSKMIPRQEESADPKTLVQAYEDVPEFREKIDSSEKFRVLYDKARRVEGLFRTHSAHAAGIIIAGEPLHSLVPMGWDQKAGLPVCQFNMKAAEAVGLVKFDFLGLKTLSIIQLTLDYIRRFRGENIDISTIPLDDSKVFEMLSSGQANGVFQLESDGMKRVLRDMRPDRFEDLIAIVALYRPGPMDNIPLYIACKNGKTKPHYPDPIDKTKPFLEETHGIMVYQEQVMQVAQVVAGYSLGEADLLRRAMGKKIPAEMDQQRAAFVKGATERGTSKRDAEDLFDHVAKFAGYGFNKSHAACYAMIAYRTAWLKANYPVEFFSALLSYETHKPERMALIKEDMDEREIEMLLPDVNNSGPRFLPERKEDGTWAVRFGLNAIKQVSGDLSILMEAREQGSFKSLPDFHARAGSQFNKGQIEKLAEAGAFDALAQSRYQAVSVLTWLSRGKKVPEGQEDLFGGAATIEVPAKVSDVQEWGNRADREFNAVGFYFSTHPIDAYRPRLERAGVRRRQSIITWMKTKRLAQSRGRKVCGMVESCENRTSRRSGNQYVTANIAEKQENYQVMFFGNDEFSLPHLRSILESAKASRCPVVIVTDFVLEKGDEGATLFGKQAWNIDEFLADVRGPMTVRLDPSTVVLNADERAALRRIDNETRKGLSSKQAEERRAAVRESSFARKLAEVKEFIAGIRDDAAKSAVPMSMVLPVEGEEICVEFKGKYVISMQAESTLKSMDGIVSVSEAA